MIRAVLVDDQELVRTGLRTLAEHDGDITIVAEAADGRRGLDAIRRHRPDVVLMDLRMPVMDGLTAIRELLGDPSLAAVRVLVLTTFDDEHSVIAAIAAGAAGYLVKDTAPAEFRHAIRVVATGDALLSPSVTQTVMRTVANRARQSPSPDLVRDLTQREREILILITRGQSNTEIGRTLHLSPDTARTYVSRLLAKLGARDRAQLVIIGYESGLVATGEK